MPSRNRRPTGVRVSLEIPPNLNALVAKSPRVVAHLAAIGREIEARADATVPTRTGHLRDSKVTDIQITPEGAAFLIGYKAFYAHIVHNGSVKLTANPWLLNAALSVLTTGAGRARLSA